MSLPLDEYRAGLINKLLFAVSQEEVKDLIDRSIFVLKKDNLNSKTIDQFIDQIIGDLKLFDPMKKQAQQWNNIKVAKVLLNRIRQNVQTQNT